MTTNPMLACQARCRLIGGTCSIIDILLGLHDDLKGNLTKDLKEWIRYLSVSCEVNCREFRQLYTWWFAEFAVCGGQLSEPVGEVTSPNYPNQYPNDRQCEWMIVMPTGRQILLNVTDFRLESHPTCDNDYLEVRYVNDVKGKNSWSTCLCWYRIRQRVIISTWNANEIVHFGFMLWKFLTTLYVLNRTRLNCSSSFSESLRNYKLNCKAIEFCS